MNTVAGTAEATRYERVAPASPEPRVSFEDVANARFELYHGAHSAGFSADADRYYRATRAAFEAAHGRVIHEVWSTTMPGGAVVTTRPPKLPITHLFGFAGQNRLHTFTDYLTKGQPELLHLITGAEELASLSEEILRLSYQRIALARAHSVLRQAFAVAEMQDVEQQHVSIMQARAELDRARAFYVMVSEQSAQIFYFWGMMLGNVLIAVIGAVAALFVPVFVDAAWSVKIDKYEIAIAFGALAAGSIGAQISVMWRITAGSFEQAASWGPENLRRLGAFRPFIGGVFGLILYFALKAGIVSKTYVPTRASVYFYLFTAFLGGFSERLVPEFLGEKEDDLNGNKRPPEASG